MKIPDSYYVSEVMGLGSRIKQAWETAAMDLMLKHGVFIGVVPKYQDPNNSDRVVEFLFEVEGHTFGSLNELVKALENKAFL